MIITADKLASLDASVAMVDGCFDPLHAGHLRYFEAAAACGLAVLCNIQNDDYIRNTKNRPPLLPAEQRIRLIDALAPIAYACICEGTTADMLAVVKPLQYLKGSDWQSRGLPVREVDICRENNIEIVYLDTVAESSTDLATRYGDALGRARCARDADVFETYVHRQKPVEKSMYDKAYFCGEWRDGGENYTIEKRRQIEGRNPINIKEVFDPERVLDVGCGPGALLTFLHELDVDVYGIDNSPAAIAAAPEHVRDRIFKRDATDFHNLGKSFDLVICREVLEHLTAFEIRRAVNALAQYTSRFIYVTTRYHPRSVSLLDITDDFQTDPTHVTVMNKDFLRILFVLEGLRSRPDLEARLDWKRAGRVLVFEKA